MYVIFCYFIPPIVAMRLLLPLDEAMASGYLSSNKLLHKKQDQETGSICKLAPDFDSLISPMVPITLLTLSA